MMVGATLSMTRQSKFSTTYHSRQLGALEAAEAGSVDVKNHLRADKTWAPTAPYTVTLPGSRASYRIQFSALPVVDPDLSINNLSGETPVDGPRGMDTVPPHSAYLVLDGFAGEVSQRLELVVRTAPFSPLQSPLVTSGPQYFSGDVLVTGIQDFNDISPVVSDIHSNSRDTGSARITWDSNPGELFKVDGAVSTTADSAGAFDLNSGPGTVDVDSTQSRAGARPFPDLNIEDIIDNASGAAITPVPGVNLVSADTKHSGNLDIQGDLVLEDADIFVDGNLTVNGSITGRGSVFVLGNTEFSGAAEVNVHEGHISLYSRGHVQLNGFRGTEFLESLAPIAEPLERVKFALSGMASEMSQYRFGTLPQDWNLRGKVDLYRALLGQNTNAFPAGIFGNIQADAAAWGLPPIDQTQGNSVGTCLAHLQSLPTGTDPVQDRTVSFLVQKLNRLQLMLDAKAYIGTTASPTDIAKVDQYLADGTISIGLVDTIIDDPTQYARAGEILEGELRNYNFDAVGNSYFKGVLYTNGALHCQNEVEIVGGVYVEKNRYSPTSTLNTGTRSLQSGDVQFDNGSRLTYVEGLLEQSPASGGNNLVTTVYWSTPPSP